LLSDVYASKRNLYQLSSAEKQKIVDVSLTKTPTAKNAEALLSLVYGNEYPLLIEKLIFSDSLAVLRSEANIVAKDTVVFPDDNKNPSMVGEPSRTINIVPNPNDGSMQVFYNLQNQLSAIFEIYNVAGHKVFSETLNPENKYIFVAQQQLPNGVYMYRVIQNGAVIAIDKLVILK
ncbi:MAG: T9SS type A sorting domain-containing protein, partial [Bacteroidota bacterium]